jgi:hypothetical protein
VRDEISPGTGDVEYRLPSRLFLLFPYLQSTAPGLESGKSAERPAGTDAGVGVEGTMLQHTCLI